MPATRLGFAATTAAAIFTLSAGALAQNAAQEQGTDRGAMTATLVEGPATAARRGGAGQPLAEGAVLHEGDVVETGAGGRVEISLATGTVLRVGESSRVELREAAPSGGAFRARLALGNLWAKVHKLLAGERFEVETENAVAGVRGTEFRVEAGGAGKEDLVRVYEGAVVCRGHGGAWSERLEPNRELRMAHGKAEGKPAAFEPASEAKHPFMTWVRARHAVQQGQGPGMKPLPVQKVDETKLSPHERRQDDRKLEKSKDPKVKELGPRGDADKKPQRRLLH
jgi:hypothetical protein